MWGIIGMKHTNKLTDEDIEKELVMLEQWKDDTRIQLRITNLNNEKKYRESLKKENECL